MAQDTRTDIFHTTQGIKQFTRHRLCNRIDCQITSLEILLKRDILTCIKRKSFIPTSRLPLRPG